MRLAARGNHIQQDLISTLGVDLTEVDAVWTQFAEERIICLADLLPITAMPSRGAGAGASGTAVLNTRM